MVPRIVFSRHLLSTSLQLLIILLIPNSMGVVTGSLQAQIIPDNTLGQESSNVTSVGVRDIVNGGAIRGNNLFHSFEEFNVESQREAYFANPTGINNIISRVTGENISRISGGLGVIGTANLFLINPHGIVFGRDARLNLQGSFWASTASSILFDQNFEFSATNPQIPPLLTINVPIGLQMGANPGRIINQSQTPSLLPIPAQFAQIPIPKNAGLQVFPGQSLGLIGGEIIIDGGGLTASGGQVFLASLASPGLVRLRPALPGFNLEYDLIEKPGRISLLNNALINTSGISSGQVNLKAGNISIDNSRIYALTFGNLDGRSIQIQADNLFLKPGVQISALTLGEGKGSDIEIAAIASVEIDGLGLSGYRQFIVNYTTSGVINPFDPRISLITATSGSGNAGNISINTNRFQTQDGVLIGSGTFGVGNAGNINIRSNTIDMLRSTISNTKTPFSIGEGGNINIETQQFTLEDEAAVSTLALGQGKGGNINIQAGDFLNILNTPTGAVLATSLTTTTLGVEAQAGDINIETKRLLIEGGGGINSANGALFGNQFFSSTRGVGGNLIIKATESVELSGTSGVLRNGGVIPSSIAAQTTTANRGGDIYISTPILSVKNGGLLSASSFGLGNAGSITIATQQMEVIGSTNQGNFISQVDVSIGARENLISTNSPVNMIGNAGSLNISTDKLLLADGGILTVQAGENANAGNINLVANQLNLDHQARIDATTNAGNGGNINLKIQDLFLRRGSRIRTDANSADGGNIAIDSRFIVAIPWENSDITANAIAGDGGKINITTQGIFGMQVAAKPTPKSDITASSQFGVNGVVTVNTLTTEPQLVDELPTELVDQSSRITQTCSTSTRTNSFAIAGKGGISYTPKEFLNPHPLWIDWRIFAPKTNISLSTNQNINIQSENNLTEANGWIIDPQGRITLIAKSPQSSLSQPSIPGKCN